MEPGVLRGIARPPMLTMVQQLHDGDPRKARVLERRGARVHCVISARTVLDPPVRFLDGEDVGRLNAPPTPARRLC